MATRKINSNKNSKQTISNTANAYPEFIQELQQLFPNINFIPGERFTFRPPNTVIFEEPTEYFELQTLHEVGHSLCGRYDWKTHVERLRIESEAWQAGKKLYLSHPEWQEKYHFEFDEEIVEALLDSYRDWLHTKSKCKKCGLTRLQTSNGKYYCPGCDLL